MVNDGTAVYSKYPKQATDENDLDLAIAVVHVGTHIDKGEDQSDRFGAYRGSRYRMAVGNVQHFESESSCVETYLVTNRKPMQIRQNRFDVTT